MKGRHLKCLKPYFLSSTYMKREINRKKYGNRICPMEHYIRTSRKCEFENCIFHETTSLH